MPIPAPATALTDTFLRTVDDRAPGLVDALYLVGSVALGDFHDGASDVDFVAVLSRHAGTADLAALSAAHAAVGREYPGIAFEGTHLSWDDVAAGADCPDAPAMSPDGFQEATRFALNPVTFAELAAAGLAVRGPEPGAVDIGGAGPDPVRAYTLDNLTTYWRPLHARFAAAGEDVPAGTVEWAACWAVLGVSRLHKVLSVGGLSTKCVGGGHALAAFDPRWHALVVDALGIRAGHPSRYGPPDVLRRDTLDFLDMAIESGLALA